MEFKLLDLTIAGGQTYKTVVFEENCFQAEFEGDGGTEVTLSGCNFDPDLIVVRCFRGWDDYTASDGEVALQCWMYDKKSTDDLGGMALCGPKFKNSGYMIAKTGMVLNNDAMDAMVQWNKQTNELIISGLITGSVKTVFANGLVYRVVAIKTPDK